MSFNLKDELCLYLNPPNQVYEMDEHLGEKWHIYKRGWQVYERTFTVKTNNKKDRVHHFLKSMEKKFSDLYYDFKWERKEDKYDVDAVIAKYDNYFNEWTEAHKENENKARSRFLSRKQEPDETLPHFATELRRMSIYCGFRHCREDKILDQTIAGMSDPALQRRLRKNPKDFQTVMTRIESCTTMSLPTKLEKSNPIPDRIRKGLSSRLKKLLEDKAIEPVTTTLPLCKISNLYISTDKAGKNLRICLRAGDTEWTETKMEDSKIRKTMRSFQLRRIMYFSIVNINYGLWDDSDKKLFTTFNTPFGIFKWKHIPFGLKYSFETRMKKIKSMIRKMECCKIIENDLIVYGMGDNEFDAIVDHEKNCREMLDKITKNNLTVNYKRAKLKQKELTYREMSIKDGSRVNCPNIDAYPEIAPICLMIMNS
uniref:uncharacterized protein LOC120338744 n=1 Tax=Styela clava TaxID=7725 RepID=UPI00193ADE36|nr:uncharacterized protein LOC120338744 [Styela clava]